MSNLASARYFGALDMLSMPPATTTSLLPNWIVCAASIVAVKETGNMSLFNQEMKILSTASKKFKRCCLLLLEKCFDKNLAFIDVHH